MDLLELFLKFARAINIPKIVRTVPKIDKTIPKIIRMVPQFFKCPGLFVIFPNFHSLWSTNLGSRIS